MSMGFTHYRPIMEKHGPALLIACIFVTAIWIQLFTLPYLDFAGLTWNDIQILKGKIIYRDTMEINPPLIIWLYLPWVWLAEHFAWERVVVVKMAAIALTAISVAACSRVLTISAMLNTGQRMSFIAALCGFLLLMPDSYVVFAQREHLLVVLILPYILERLPSVDRRRLSVPLQAGIAVMAAIGFCLKPYFFLIWLAVLFYGLYSGNRAWRSLLTWGDSIILLVTLLYSLSVYLFAPEYLAQLPILIRLYPHQGFLGETVLDKAVWFTGVAIIGGAVAWMFGLFRLPSGALYKKDIRYLILVACAAYVESLLQFKTHGYMYFPFLALGMLPVSLMILLRPITHVWAFILMAWLFYPLTPLTDNRQTDENALYADMMQALTPYAQAKKLYYIGLALPPSPFLLHENRLQWTSKFTPFQALLIGMMEPSPVTHRPTTIVEPGKEDLEHWILQGVAADLAKERPEVIMIEDYGSQNDAFDFLRWFGKEPAITAFLAHYQPAPPLAICADPVNPPPCQYIRRYTLLIPRKD